MNMEELRELVTQFHFINDVWTVMLPVILMGLDFLTGTINAWIKGELDSSKMRKGLGKKLGEISAILIGELFVCAFGLSIVVASAISIYIIVMELISICENLEELGVPIPKFIKRALAITNDKINEDDKEEDSEDDKEE